MTHGCCAIVLLFDSMLSLLNMQDQDVVDAEMCTADHLLVSVDVAVVGIAFMLLQSGLPVQLAASCMADGNRK